MAMLVRALICEAVLLSIITFSKSQDGLTKNVLPSTYTVTGNEVVNGSVNGSSLNGNCSDYRIDTCFQPNTSVLFNGRIPTLTNLSNDMWASQLLTLNTTNKIQLTFDVHAVAIVEVVLFNCPEWRIGVSNIGLNSNPSVSLTINSCNSLVRVCMPCDDCANTNTLQMTFLPATDASWVHIAEVTFYDHTTTECRPEAIITAPPLDITMSPHTILSGTTTTPDDTIDNTAMDATITLGGTNTNTTTAISISAIIFFVLLILVCVVAVFLLWRYKHSKRNATTLWEGTQAFSRPHPPTLGLSEETGQGQQYSVVNNHSLEGSQENEYAHINDLYTTLQQESREEENTGGYTMPQIHSVAGNTESAATTNAATTMHPLQTQLNNMRDIQNTLPEESIGIYSVIINPDPPNEYIKPNRKEDRETTASHPPEDDTAMERLYAKVDKKKKRKKTKDDPDEQSTGIYSVITNPDPQSPANEESAHRKSREGSAEEPEIEYSLVLPNQLTEETFTPPQIPPKSDQLIDKLNN